MEFLNWKLDEAKKTTLLLFLILLLGLFFRVYKLEIFYPFAHDQDLYSFIVKDILVDKHLRLIGQLTSIDGVFIGPIFYYLLVPFYALFKLNPLAATIPATLISQATIFSFYFTFSKIFNKTTGFIAAFVYAISIPNVFFDRWVVPTQPVIIWSIWFLYALFLLLKAKSQSYLILGTLLGLIWHIHIALLPLIFLIPLTLIVSKNGSNFLLHKKFDIKKLLLPFAIFFLLTTPFFLFEFRHNFQQIRGLISSISENRQQVEGLGRLIKIFDSSSGYMLGNFISSGQLPPILNFLVLIFLVIFLKIRAFISNSQILIMGSWIIIVILSQLFSKREISEYYFTNLLVISLLFLSLFLSYLYSQNKRLIIFLLGGFLLINFFILIFTPSPHNGFVEQRKLVEYIKKDVQKNNYSCIGINYIAKMGTNVGFRYLLWWKELDVILPNNDVPIYQIVIPWEYSPMETKNRFGSYGLILPANKKIADDFICQNPNYKLPPLLGFTK